MSDIVQSLWIGSELSKLEQLCLKSFLDNGFIFHLYVYDKVKYIPNGVIIKDGNEILDKSEIFTYKNGSVSAFSNLFRFTMLYKKGGYWVDTDIVCVKNFKINSEIAIASEPNDNYDKNVVSSFLIKLPEKSQIALEAINIILNDKKDVITGKIEWGCGPKTINTIVNKFNLNKYILPWNTVCSCGWADYKSVLNPDYRCNSKTIKKKEDIPNEMIIIHLWNNLFRNHKIDKNGKYNEYSLFEVFKKKHNIK